MIDLSTPMPTFNLELKDSRDELAELILADINNYCEETYNTGFRDHLGASIMGEDCSRKLWYTFRWVKEEFHEGRIQRLFQVGHQAEPRLIQLLRGAGFEVHERDPNTKKQFRITGCNGHYGGSLDGMCKAPTRYGLNTDLVFLNEFKTNGTGAGFANVGKNGVMKEKPKHYAQMCGYGKFYQLKYGLYIIENKNDSDLIIEIVPLDWNYGTILENKASDVINSKFPPSRISDNPDYFDCKYCFAVNVCHHGEAVEVNCRSCKMSEPVANAEWFCNRFQKIIPKDFIKEGCGYHSSINE